MNPILDPYPSDYKGYLIRTDFRIGIQITLCMEDPELTENEKSMICVQLLYGSGIPPVKTAIDGITWFMSGGQEKTEGGDGKTVMSFEHDAGRILSGFRRIYGIDLNRAKMHWFEFLSLLGDLGDCALNSVIDIRTRDMTGMKGRSRQHMERLKEKYALPVVYSREEQDMIDAFFNSGKAGSQQDTPGNG